jgi:hypothetical protein
MAIWCEIVLSNFYFLKPFKKFSSVKFFKNPSPLASGGDRLYFHGNPREYV